MRCGGDGALRPQVRRAGREWKSPRGMRRNGTDRFNLEDSTRGADARRRASAARFGPLAMRDFLAAAPRSIRLASRRRTGGFLRLGARERLPQAFDGAGEAVNLLGQPLGFGLLG